jgi:hypothetical protein
MTPNAIAEHFDTTRQAVLRRDLRLLTEGEFPLNNELEKGRERLMTSILAIEKMKEIDEWIRAMSEQFEES